MSDFSIGVDLGGTNLRIAAVSGHGKLIEKLTLGTQVSLGRDHVLDEMCAAIRQLSEKYGASGNLLGVGIGVPGIIHLATGRIYESPNLPGWADSPVRDEIEKRLGARVFLENDANAAALGEKWLGAGRDVPHLVMITLGTGVGGGIVLNGSVWHGMNGMAGELGHITVDPDGPLCGCGNYGCVEAISSATAIVRMAKEAIASGKAPGLEVASHSDPEFSSKSIYNLAIQGDEEARRIYQRVGWALGIMIAGLVNALNLNMYVIGGGVASAWDAFSPAIFAELRKRSLVYAATDGAGPVEGAVGASALVTKRTAEKTIVTRALLGSDAGLFGAARIPLIASGV
jgi:glucokinase